MIQTEFTVNTLEEFKQVETWLFSLTFPWQTNITIYCGENATTYFYKLENIDGKLLVATDGEENTVDEWEFK